MVRGWRPLPEGPIPCHPDPSNDRPLAKGPFLFLPAPSAYKIGDSSDPDIRVDPMGAGIDHPRTYPSTSSGHAPIQDPGRIEGGISVPYSSRHAADPS